MEGWIPADTLGTRLVLVRRQLGLTQRAAADKCGLTFGEWQSIEDGRAARGLDVKIARISLALGVDRAWLAWGGPLAHDDATTTELGQEAALTRKRAKSSNKWFRPRTQRNAGRYSRKRALTMTATHRGRPAA